MQAVEGYWKGFFQIKMAVKDGKVSPNEFSKEPIHLYCKIEQTGDVVLGRYSVKFDAEAFKKQVLDDGRRVEGVISGRFATLRFHDTTSSFFEPPMEAKMRLSDGALLGEWVQKYESLGGVQVIYSGVMELRKY